MNKIIKILTDINQINDYLINEWKKIQNQSLSKNNIFTVALSGGNSPIPFYQKLAEQKDKFNWTKTFIFIVDERYVPFNHDDNNFKMIRENLLDIINIPETNLFPIKTNLPINESVIDYEKRIKLFFNTDTIPSFDIILLGIGNDGHTASLFPGNKVLNESKKFVASVEDKKIKQKRITLTYPIINNAKNIIFLATGTNKAEVIKEIIVNKNKKNPASKVNPLNGNLIFVLDKDAGKELIK